ncbi:MAG: ABC transporter permease [Acidimicrobiaceae bacterium]|jgi:general nucleoside transport system permease protein|nr:ABC transporter permease [Acidimicrobiaceae bacterium]MBT7430658.1 ABC transporter permease [Ilumatobacter sp.]
MMLALIENAFLSLAGSAIPASTVVVLAATGVLLNERVGVMNLGQEGLIGIGAVYSVIAVSSWSVGSPWIAMLVGMIAAAVAGLVFALFVVVFKASQVLVGLALALGGIGLSNQLGTNRNGTPIQVQFQEVNPGGKFDDNDFFEAFLFHEPPVYLAYIVIPAFLWFLLFRTRHGMNMRAVGENPAAADAVGVSVTWSRLGYTVLGAALAGAGGAYMVLSFTPTWSPDIARGRGWVALAVVIFAGWRPFRAVAGALLYGGMISLGVTAQARGWDLPALEARDLAFFLSMLPFLVTLIAILIPAGAAKIGRRVRSTAAPAALATPYSREDR